METIDIVVLIPILYFGFKGFQSGLLKEILSIVGLIIAVFLTLNYLDEFAQLIKQSFGLQEDYNPFIVGVVLFVGVMIITNIITYFLSKLISVIQLSTVNKLLGLAFGGLKAGILVSSILIFLAGFNYPNDKVIAASKTYPVVIKIAPLSYDILAKIYPGASSFQETIKKTIDENNPLNQFSF